MIYRGVRQLYVKPCLVSITNISFKHFALNDVNVCSRRRIHHQPGLMPKLWRSWSKHCSRMKKTLYRPSVRSTYSSWRRQCSGSAAVQQTMMRWDTYSLSIDADIKVEIIYVEFHVHYRLSILTGHIHINECIISTWMSLYYCQVCMESTFVPVNISFHFRLLIQCCFAPAR